MDPEPDIPTSYSIANLHYAHVPSTDPAPKFQNDEEILLELIRLGRGWGEHQFNRQGRTEFLLIPSSPPPCELFRFGGCARAGSRSAAVATNSLDFEVDGTLHMRGMGWVEVRWVEVG